MVGVLKVVFVLRALFVLTTATITFLCRKGSFCPLLRSDNVVFKAKILFVLVKLQTGRRATKHERKVLAIALA